MPPQAALDYSAHRRLRFGEHELVDSVGTPRDVQPGSGADLDHAPEQYGGLSRMVNRNDATVIAVFISGQQVVANGQPTDLLGKVRTDSFLRVGRRSPAVAPLSTERSVIDDQANANSFARQ